MTAEILCLDDNDTYLENIRTAAQALRSGRIVAFPTETVYGLGVCADNERAIDNLYRAKQRPRHKQLSIMIAEPDDVTKHVKHIPLIAGRLISAFWPGPLTIVFDLPNNRTVGIRNSSHHVVRDLLNAAGKSIVSTSTNISGRPPATDAQQVISNFSDKVDVILDGGPAEAGKPSTVVKIVDNTFKIVRHGVIGKERLNRCLNEDCLSIRS
ncbi:MAG: putative threonylcarbamoyl-AMP synthase [Candidatus Scalindua arabica]|uniref:L-threonylcarbamoyladenylate synthase n=1 Tax=Candidatus Scalindua arabica TaxID=1127984 RepID=A0A941W1E2_9BACT|nr:putative threonylcarbamoyl-AMP synthase [Candidatus Scalindua arabica]